MAEFIYTMKKARKAHGDKVILDDVTLMFLPGAKIGVLGPNGAGKSTVLQIMAGLQQPSNGEAYLTPGYSVGILLQEPPLNEDKNVLENVQEGVAETIERRRVALCKLLLQKPDLLLLDEPTNHLDAESVLWLEQHLSKYEGTVVAITHDRYFLDNVAQWILELDRGRAYPYEGNYTTYLETKEARMKVEGQKDAKRAKRLKEELEWVRMNAKGRQTKSKARLARYEEMAAEADKTRKLDFEEIQIPPGPRLGDVVVECQNLVKGFGDRILIDDLSFTLPRNGIVGVIGPNGAGKTTLFKTILGMEKADSGLVKVGETVKISYVDQSRGGIDPKKSLWEVVSDGLDFIKVGNVEMPSRAYVSAFGFKGPDQQKPAGVLSGGERNRLNLALTLKQGGNLLLLDEPTNDLDVETLSSLENALLEFPGCAVVISHDRWFLDRVATHILAYEGESKWFWFEGNFESYEENKISRLGIDAARPHRATYRKLTR
ncbi:MAG: energy-dependent translational throttle protein EttA [Actinobacteria bacterium]|nr:energy-dependent translational throttle protein EttA [Actinomycetota bacterium]